MAEQTEQTKPERRRFFAVVRKSDQRVLALCEDVVDAARAALRFGRRFQVHVREADVDLTLTFTGRWISSP
jgi:hypothetical protein